MKAVTVLSASLVDDHIHVIKEIIEDDDTVSLNLHIFARDTLEWRAAEYDIDPTTDLDTLINFVLYEPFVNNKALYEHNDRAAARAEMHTLIEQAKVALSPARRPVGSGKSGAAFKALDARLKNDDDPYEAIKKHSEINSEAVDLKREHVTRVFNMRDEILKDMSTSPDRIALLRENLAGRPER